MAAATAQDMIYMIPELSSLDSGVITFWLAEAQRLVILDGFALIDENFDLLQRYMAGHLLYTNNVIRGTVESESVQGSISASYGNTKDENYSDLWWRKYVTLKTRLGNVLGSRVV